MGKTEQQQHHHGDDELDLYGDAEGLELIENNEVAASERSADGDLYDAAVEPSTDAPKRSYSPIVFDKSNISSTSNTSSGRHYCCYLGNMTWWTTDEDVQNVIYGAGIGELIDIKFCEDRQNGKSRGVAVAVFSLESAVRQCMEKLSTKQLHGQKLVVLPYVRASLDRLTGGVSGNTRKSTLDDDKKKSDDHQPGVQHLGTVRLGAAAPKPQPLVATNFDYRPPATHFQPAPLMIAPRPMLFIPPVQQQYLPPPVAYQPPPPATYSLPPPPPGVPPHVNPHVFGHALYTPTAPSSVSAPLCAAAPSVESSMAKGEFEEIMNRNRTVSSSAISRAVSDAAAGDFVSAIETLVTAIALIRSSRVTEDPRCKVMITSLQDTLHGVEAKSYARDAVKKERSRHRSRSPDDRKRRRHNSSSHSRDRHSSSAANGHRH
uniref:RRM domain-containing protein n=1 Tax=Plectus sambesii TaxID=2011161 RepID=A0A914XSI6_9BILA